MNTHVNLSSTKDILLHLERCDRSFYIPVSQYVDLSDYSLKIFEYATRYEIFDDDSNLVALIAYYKNEHYFYITNVSTLPSAQGKGFATLLLNNVSRDADLSGQVIKLEVASEDQRTIEFYKRFNFSILSDVNNLNKIEMVRYPNEPT